MGRSGDSCTGRNRYWISPLVARAERSRTLVEWVQIALHSRYPADTSESSDRRGIQSALGQRRSRKPDARRLSRLIAATSDSRDPRMITSSCARVIAVYNNSRVNT